MSGVNIVPRSDQNAGLGTLSKKWSHVISADFIESDAGPYFVPMSSSVVNTVLVDNKPTIFFGSKYGFQWCDGYFSVVKFSNKVAEFPNCAHMSTIDPDFPGSLCVCGVFTMKYDKKNDRLNMFVVNGDYQSYPESTVFSDMSKVNLIHFAEGVDFDTNSDVVVKPIVTVSVSSYPPTKPSFINTGDMVELCRFYKDGMYGDLTEISTELAAAFTDDGLQTFELEEDATINFFELSYGKIKVKELREV